MTPNRADYSEHKEARMTVTTITTQRRLSYGATKMTTGEPATFDLWHERQSADSQPLLQQQPYHYSDASVSLLFSSKGAQKGVESEAGGRANRPAGFKNFRLVIGFLLLLSAFLYNYANYTIYIAAIEMVSNDVIQSGMTELRAKHLSADPLAVSKNAAAPGTCPIESKPSSLKQQSVLTKETGPQLNASQISDLERIVMHLDTSTLLTSVHERVANGKLVDWTITERSYIFTAHNLGGILLAVPINRLGLVYGIKLMIFVCVLSTGLRMLLLPLVAGHLPVWATFLFELAVGGPGGSIGILSYPLMSVWVRPDEANLFMVVGGIVALLGTASTNFLSTQLLAQQLDWSWCFYLPGIALVATALVWLVLGANRPEESRFVGAAELELLADTIAKRTSSKLAEAQLDQEAAGGWPQAGAHTAAGRYESCFCDSLAERAKCAANKTRRQPNWCTIFTCPTIWALIAANFAFHWNSKVATLWPTYFTNILHLDSATIGLVTGLKGVVALLFGSLFAFLTRKLVLRPPCGISLTAYRRLNQLIATLVVAVSVALMALMDCDFWANTASVLITPLVTSFNALSHDQMPLDLSAEDSGLLVSVIRLLAPGDIMALPVSSYVLSHAPDAFAGDRLTWRLVWLLGLALKILACTLFVCVAKSQPKSYSQLVPLGPCRSSAAR